MWQNVLHINNMVELTVHLSICFFYLKNENLSLINNVTNTLDIKVPLKFIDVLTNYFGRISNMKDILA